jgi:hypothetical protein
MHIDVVFPVGARLGDILPRGRSPSATDSKGGPCENRTRISRMQTGCSTTKLTALFIYYNTYLWSSPASTAGPPRAEILISYHGCTR